MDNGWIKLHRKLLDSLVFGNEKCLKIWIWCLLKAGHRRREILLGRQKITLEAGQFIMGSDTAVETLKLAKATIWYWLNFLESQGNVVLQKTSKYTVVTIPNWESYQHELDADETLAERWVGTNKNDKKEKNTTLATAREICEVSDSEPPREKTPPKTTPEMKQVFALFAHNPDRAQWKLREVERNAAEALYQTYGLDKLKAMLAQWFLYKDLDYCPQMNTPSEMLRGVVKMGKFIRENT